MPNLKAALATALVLLCLIAPGVHAQDAIFTDFQFKQLKFTFHPAGLDQRADSDGKGSALAVHADRILVEGDAAKSLRACIDGSYCDYQIPGGNKDGNVTQGEVDSFSTFAQIGLKSKVEAVNEFAKMLQNNVSVDGMTGKNVIITKVVLEDAVGRVDSTQSILVYLDAKVTYDNDGAAKKHAIAIKGLVLKDSGFTYEQVLFESGDAAWKFDDKGVKPDAARPKVDGSAYLSDQATFEGFTAQGLELAIAKGGGKKSPGPEVPLVLLGLALLALVGRRR